MEDCRVRYVWPPLVDHVATRRPMSSERRRTRRVPVAPNEARIPSWWSGCLVCQSSFSRVLWFRVRDPNAMRSSLEERDDLTRFARYLLKYNSYYKSICNFDMKPNYPCDCGTQTLLLDSFLPALHGNNHSQNRNDQPCKHQSIEH